MRFELRNTRIRIHDYICGAETDFKKEKFVLTSLNISRGSGSRARFPNVNKIAIRLMPGTI